MISLGASLAVLVFALQSPAADSLRLAAVRVSETDLVTETRARPLAAREAITAALDRNELDAARNLAAAFAVAWSDSFLVREVSRFAAWPPESRAAKVWNDSVRRAGISAFSRDGPHAAIVIWRPALHRAEGIPDTAGIASLLGNMGTALLADGKSDTAETYLTRALALAEAVGDQRVQANATMALAGLAEDRGNLAASRDGYTRALALQERIGDSRGMAAAYNDLGLLAQDVGDLDEARRQFEAALALNRRDGRDEVAASNLVNLAGVASLGGDFATAERQYRDALTAWRAREQWADAASALHGLGQLEIRRGDYPAAEARLREALAIYDSTGPIADALAVRRELAAAHSARGDLQGALDELRRAERMGDATRGPLDVRAGLTLAHADYAMQLNTLDQAERLYGRAEYLYRQAGNPGGEAEAQEGRGLLFLERENYTRARTLLATAERTQRGGGHARSAALTRGWLGLVSLRVGDTVAARRAFAGAAADLERLGDPVGAAAALDQWARLEASAGNASVAESLYRAGLIELGTRIAPEVAWRLHSGLGQVLRGRGQLDEAARELRAALAEIDRPSRSLVLAERRSAYLADKWEAYAQLALTERARGLAGAAFEVSERLRAREMLELLARGRVTAGDSSLALAEREQDLRRYIADLTAQATAPSSGTEALRGPDPSGGSQATLTALSRAQGAYAELLLEMRERAPRHADLVASGVAGWQDVASRLGSDEAFVEYLVSDSASLAFVVTRDTLAVVDLGITRTDLARLVKLTRGAVEAPSQTGSGALWRGPLQRLNDYLFAPVEGAGLLAAKTRLIVVPHAELHYLPFTALLDRNGKFLIQRYEVTFAPSASVWLALGGRKPEPSTAGTLAFAPRPDALPASRREVAALSQLADARVLTGDAATEAIFRREAPTYRVLHLATYGVLNKQNPLFSFVELAPGSDQDGRLEVHEVFGMHLSADLVVLSACQTGLASGALADVPPGDDWVGLTRAFLHAGARRVVATLWPVDDWATAALMERFYQGYASGAEPGQALAAAQRALLIQPATANPFYWAGFVAVGGAGSGGRP